MTPVADAFRFSVADAVFDRFPNYTVGCVIATEIDNTQTSQAIDHLLDEAEQAILRRFVGTDPKTMSLIAAWRDAFAACGWTPSKFPSSVEALVKRVMRGYALPRINPLVDLVNVAVLTHLVPIGAHDLATLPVNALSVRFSTPADMFQPMGDAPDEVPDVDEIIYASGTSVRTRRWVWRQSRAALVSAATSRVFILVDGFAPSTLTNVESAVDFLGKALTEHLGASTERTFVNMQQPTYIS